MKKLSMKIIDPIGVHAKVAASIVNIASQFESNIYLINNNKKANMKSILNILALGIASEEDICIEISGSDEDIALQGIYNYLTSNNIAK
ncbi:phosphocarrier protein HPr [Bacilli bacterium PM5-3]|nr:phosphocarrier protein HPr [Bacilli bacterium PM5-3]